MVEVFLKRKEEEEDREKKVGKDDRSFLQKYVSESPDNYIQCKGYILYIIYVCCIILY